MIYRSVLSALTSKEEAHSSEKMSFTSTVLIMSKKKAANAQRKSLKDLQKAWRTDDQDHLKKYKKVYLIGSKI